MCEGLRRHGLAHVDVMLKDGSPLIDDGYVRADGLAAARHRIAAGAYAVRDFELCRVLVLDQTLRAFS